MEKRKKLFKDNAPCGTVVLNWLGESEREFTYFAEAFHEVARKAAVDLSGDPNFGLYGSPREFFKAYPIVFMYRHALELHMKAVILAASQKLPFSGNDRENLFKTHSLDTLRQRIEKVFDAYGWGWDLGIPHMQTVEDFRQTIDELASIDAKSDAFRYPVDTKGKPSLSSHFRFDLFEFCDTLDGILLALKGATIGAYEEYQAAAEAAAEARSCEME